MVPNLDRELLSLHRASQDMQVPIRKAAHIDALETGAHTVKAPRGPATTGSSYKIAGGKK